MLFYVRDYASGVDDISKVLCTFTNVYDKCFFLRKAPPPERINSYNYSHIEFHRNALSYKVLTWWDWNERPVNVLLRHWVTWRHRMWIRWEKNLFLACSSLLTAVGLMVIMASLFTVCGLIVRMYLLVQLYFCDCNKT